MTNPEFAQAAQHSVFFTDPSRQCWFCGQESDQLDEQRVCLPCRVNQGRALTGWIA